MSSIERHIRTIMAGDDGTIQIAIWTTNDGRYQANVKERASDGWTCYTDTDPLLALSHALFQRSTRHPRRDINVPPGAAKVLMYHPESNALFEGPEYDLSDGLIVDVTGIAEYENLFIAQTFGSSVSASDDDFEDLL